MTQAKNIKLEREALKNEREELNKTIIENALKLHLTVQPLLCTKRVAQTNLPRIDKTKIFRTGMKFTFTWPMGQYLINKKILSQFSQK